MTRQPGVLAALRASWDSLAIALVTAALLYASFSLSRTAAWIPRLVLACTLICVVLQLSLAIRRRRHSVPPAAAAVPQASARGAAGVRPALALAWVVSLPLGVLVLGKALGAALFVLAYMRWHGREGWVISVIFAAILGSLVQLLFNTAA